jgi:uncharacterized SAM-binding protein YcdF (DUF218 family)
MLRGMMNPGDTQPLAPIHPHPTSPTLARDRRRSPARGRGARWLLSIALTLATVLIVGIAGLVTLIYWQARTDEARPVDAIVVMGAAQYNGRPSPVFRARLEHTLDHYNAGLAPVIVVTGGSQPGDQFTEGDVAQAWLVERGVPSEAIRVEREGRNTWDSVRGIPALLPAEEETRVLAVSDGFHLFRSELMLRELGYSAYSSAAPGSPISPGSPAEFWYVIREAGAVLAFVPEMLFD